VPKQSTGLRRAEDPLQWCRQPLACDIESSLVGFVLGDPAERRRALLGRLHLLAEWQRRVPETERLYITFTVAGELAAGVSLADRGRWEEFLAPFHVLAENADVSWQYGRAWRYLLDNNLLIGTNNLWIAATALAYGMPVVTRNAKHYRRIPGLQVEEYCGKKWGRG
jgi:predicted nucleic acid-binding protein